MIHSLILLCLAAFMIYAFFSTVIACVRRLRWHQAQKEEVFQRQREASEEMWRQIEAKREAQKAAFLEKNERLPLHEAILKSIEAVEGHDIFKEDVILSASESENGSYTIHFYRSLGTMRLLLLTVTVTNNGDVTLREHFNELSFWPDGEAYLPLIQAIKTEDKLLCRAVKVALGNELVGHLICASV